MRRIRETVLGALRVRDGFQWNRRSYIVQDFDKDGMVRVICIYPRHMVSEVLSQSCRVGCDL